jgi:hypothetical protein
MNRQALPGVFVQQRENAKTASIFSLVGHEVPAAQRAAALRSKSLAASWGVVFYSP